MILLISLNKLGTFGVEGLVVLVATKTMRGRRVAVSLFAHDAT